MATNTTPSACRRSLRAARAWRRPPARVCPSRMAILGPHRPVAWSCPRWLRSTGFQTAPVRPVSFIRWPSNIQYPKPTAGTTRTLDRTANRLYDFTAGCHGFLYFNGLHWQQGHTWMSRYNSTRLEWRILEARVHFQGRTKRTRCDVVGALARGKQKFNMGSGFWVHQPPTRRVARGWLSNLNVIGKPQRREQSGRAAVQHNHGQSSVVLNG